ncbi:MAG: DUF1554 domain-containing protein, partial [Dehalococcoidia bacterium]|nr:DUF1554 domain-containing protein [Dehalococcoidia bacterium]
MAESPTALAGAPWEVYTGAGMARNYTFQDQTPGLKTIFVDFRDSDGNTQSETAQIELLAPPSPSPVPSPSPSVVPSPSPSPSPASVYTTAYRLAENLADFTDTPYSPQNPHGWQPYASAGLVASYGFDNQNAGLKTVLVQYKDSNGRVTCDGTSNYCSVQVRLLGDAPEKRSCSLGTDGSTAILNIIGINFGSTQGTAATGTTARQIRQWRNNNVQVDWPSAPIGQNLNVTLTTADGQSVDVTCSSLSQLALGAKVFCRQPSSHQTANVNLTIAEAIPSGRLVREKVSIDKDGVVQGITQKLEEGKQYNLSIKAPKALRKTTTFTAGPGTTNLSNFILWVGDIFPADGGDGLINGLDKGELNRQWNVSSEVKGRPGDFNQDDRVNSIDWACMRVSMVDANGRGDDPEAVPAFPPSPSPSPSGRPMPCAPGVVAGTAGCVIPSPNSSASPNPTASPVAGKRVFVTAATYNGNLGGLSGADAKCQASANAVNLGGTWKAWLSDSNTSAGSRLNHSDSPYRLLNGTTIANNWDDLVDG